MNRTRTLVVVLAGGAGGRLELLTHERAKPAVSFAGTHRLIDFPLSNCRNAGLSDVWVVQQFNPISLSDHLASGRPWDLDRTNGGLLILQPRIGHDGRDGFPNGTADALWRNGPMIREFAPDALVVVSADAVYALDYAAVVAEQRGGRRRARRLGCGGHDGHHRGRARRRRPLRRRATRRRARDRVRLQARRARDEHRLQRGLRLQPARAAGPPRRAGEGVGRARGSRQCAPPGPRRGRPRARAPLRRLLA